MLLFEFFPAFIALNEAESLLSVEEFDLALAGANDLGGHPAATCAAARRTAAIAAESTAGSAAAAEAITASATAAEPVTTATGAPVVATETGRTALRKRLETVFTETIPLVAPPAATTSIVTHEPN